MSLAAARRVRAKIAANEPPANGWPRIRAEGHARHGELVPKCSIFDCTEPGVVQVRFERLDTSYNGTTTFACLGHLDHFAGAGAEWVR